MQPNRNLLVLIIIGAIIVAASVFYLKTPPNAEIQDSDEDTQKPESEPESEFARAHLLRYLTTCV